MNKSTNNETLDKKSRYNPSRNSYMTKDGRYAYITWDDENKCNITHYVEVGKDGVTEEILIFLDEDDHDADLQERYNDDNADYGFQNKRLDYYKNQEDEDFTDPINKIADKHSDPFDLLFPM